MPSGAAKVEEAEIGFLFPECVRIDTKGQFGVRVPELRRNPANALPRGQSQARERVSAVVKSELMEYNWEPSVIDRSHPHPITKSRPSLLIRTDNSEV